MDANMDVYFQRATALDAHDPLAGFRERFLIADEQLLYLDGNSLGRMPIASREKLHALIDEQWGERLIRSWGEDWYHGPERIGEKIGALIGAQPGEVIVGDSTTVNLYKCILAALSLRPDRKAILSDVLNFPTDLYAIQGVMQVLGADYKLRLLASEDEISVSMEAYAEALHEDLALVTFSTPTFKSGYLHPIETMTRMAHDVGALVLWDFSHAVGAVPLDATGWDLDFAVGCCYKYLNGGPGAPAFLYVREKHRFGSLSQPWGWWGHTAPFSFEIEYEPAMSMRRFLVGTPPVLSMMAIEPAVEIVLEAGMELIREKALALGEFFLEMFDHMLAPLGFRLGSPRDPQRRGSHISIRHAEGYRIYQALVRQQNMIPDFREPDNIRLGFAPLYTSFGDIVEAVRRLQRVLENGQYLAYGLGRADVT